MTARFAILFFVLSSQLSAQALQGLKDSLKAAYTNKPEAVPHWLGTMGNYYLGQGKYDSAKLFFKKLYLYGKHTGNASGEASGLNNIGTLFVGLDMPDSSIHYYERAVSIYRSLKDTSDLPITLANLGLIYKKTGKNEEAMARSFEALPMLEELLGAGNVSADRLKSLGNCYNTIGGIYFQLDSTGLALDYYYKALVVRKKLQQPKSMAVSYNNIGIAYLSLKQYDSALGNFGLALKLKKSLNDSAASTLSNIGEVMMNTGRYAEAESYFLRSLRNKIEEKDKAGAVITLNNLGRLRLNAGKLRDSEEFLDEASKIAHELGIIKQLKDNLELRMALYDLLKDPSRQLSIAKELLIVKDQFLNEEMTKSLAEMRVNYNAEKNEQRIKLLEANSIIDKNRLKMLIIIVSLILVASLLLIYSIIVARRSKQKVEMLLKELHHRVKNNLQVLSSLLSLQSQQLTDDNAIQAVKSSEGRVNAMALIHRKLYLDDKNRTIDIKDYITELVNYLVYTYGYHEKVSLNLQIEAMPPVDVDKAIPLGLILNELISNAFKYAYAGHVAPELYVGIANPGGGTLVIQVRDNGTGMPEPKKGAVVSFGLKMVNTLIRELRGNLAVTVSEGTAYVLNIPL